MNQAVPTIESNATTLEAETPACAACPHPWAAHDRIAMRFCTATTTENHHRGCVCTAGQ